MNGATTRFNAWRGCTKVSAGCANCFAEKQSGRNPAILGEWGPNGKRVVGAESYWQQALRWNREAEKAGERRRVFCASLADVFEDWPGVMHDTSGNVLYYNSAATWWVNEPTPHGPITMSFVRKRLISLVRSTPHLDWLFVTKRPENAMRMLVEAELYAVANPDLPCPQPNLWIGTSVEDQATADERLSYLVKIPAAVRFVSGEPLLALIDFVGWGDAAPEIDPESYPEQWADHTWPEWVPETWRRHIEEFWSEGFGRSPRQWARDNVIQKTPGTGARMGIDQGEWLVPARSSEATLTGRYLHCWNNVGRLVTDKGESVPAYGANGPGWLSPWIQRDGSYAHRIHQVIVGGESGPGARPCDVAWIRSIVRQCKAAGVSAFVKQLGAKPFDSTTTAMPAGSDRAAYALKLRDRKGGDPDEWPEDLRVRDLPTIPATV